MEIMNRKRKLKFLSFLLITVLLINSFMTSVSYAKPKVRLNKTKITLTLGNSVLLKVKNTKVKPKWSSSNKSVARVTPNGDVIAKKAGNAKITAKVGKKKYTCNVTVPKQYISKNSLTLHVGENTSIEVYGVSFNDMISWTSDDNDIASVSEDGIISGQSKGKTVIYCTVSSGVNKIYKCNVTVVDNNEFPNETIQPATPKPIVTPAPVPTATSKPIVTPSSIPTATPSAKPVIPPEVKPTQNPEEILKPSSTPDIFLNGAYDKLAKYIMTYGAMNTSDGTYGIADSTILNHNDHSYLIIFEPKSNSFQFMYLGESNSSDVGLSMFIYPEKLDKTKVEFVYVSKGIKDSCFGTTYIDIAKYRRGKALEFTYDKNVNVVLEKTYNELGSTCFELSTMLWDMLLERAGLTIKELGFVSY